MKLLVTGAAGFIGYHAARKMLERGDEVVGLDNLNDYYDVRLKLARLELLQRLPGFRFVKLDLEDRAGMTVVPANLTTQSQIAASILHGQRSAALSRQATQAFARCGRGFGEAW